MSFIINPFFGGFDPAYQAVLDRATALGYTHPSLAQETKQDTLMRALRSDGILSLLDVLYIFATDGSSDFATLNWITPSLYKCTKVATPTFTTNEGFDFNGTTQYLDTNWNPATNGVNYTINDCSYGAHVNDTNSNTGRVDFGCDNGTSFISFAAHNSSTEGRFRINDAVNTQPGVTTEKFFQVKRLGVANPRKFLYKTGVLALSNNDASIAIPSFNIYIGATNASGTASLFCNREISMFFAGSSLDGKELLLYNNWNTYFTSL